MDNPECTLLSIVKVEDDLEQMKQELDHESKELEFVQVEDSLSVDETFLENATAGDSGDTLLVFSEDELVTCGRPFSLSKVDFAQRRRLRFSEADDMVLLRRVAALNPYKCSALWKEVRQVVALRAGKNFSVRSIRDHTDLLMNTYCLRGVETCLKRTPPDLQEKKKRLLKIVQDMWKKDTVAIKSAGNTANGKRAGKDSAADNQQGLQNNTAGVDPPNPDPSPESSISRSNITQPATSSTSLKSSVSKSPSVPLLVQQNTPVKLRFGTPAPSLACSPLLASALPSNMQQLAISGQLGLQKLTVPSTFSFPAWGRHLPSKLVLAPVTNSSPGPEADSMFSDQPLPLVSKGTATPDAPPVPEMIDRCTSPIPAICSLATENGSVTPSDNPTASQKDSLDNSTEADSHVTSEVEKKSKQYSDSKVKRTPRTNSMLRAKLLFLQSRHRDEYALRVKDLSLKKRRLALEAKKLDLEDRKVRLEEEKWKLEKKEREEKLLLLTEERQNKIAMERRQQSMIDILLELKKKE